MTTIKELKRPIRAFLREHYTDERLAMLLAHAQEGKLVYDSCCCFIGIPTAAHALQSSHAPLGGYDHYLEAQDLPGSRLAEMAFAALPNHVANDGSWDAGNAIRRRILIPMIRAEIRRRELARIPAALPVMEAFL